MGRASRALRVSGIGESKDSMIHLALSVASAIFLAIVGIIALVIVLNAIGVILVYLFWGIIILYDAWERFWKRVDNFFKKRG